MAVVYVTEFTDSTIRYSQINPVSFLPPVAEQTVAIGGTSAQSSEFNDKTKIIRVHTDAVCSIEVGSDPTATTSNLRLAANSTEYFEVNPGDKIAVITNT